MLRRMSDLQRYNERDEGYTENHMEKLCNRDKESLE